MSARTTSTLTHRLQHAYNVILLAYNAQTVFNVYPVSQESSSKNHVSIVAPPTLTTASKLTPVRSAQPFVSHVLRQVTLHTVLPAKQQHIYRMVLVSKPVLIKHLLILSPSAVWLANTHVFIVLVGRIYAYRAKQDFYKEINVLTAALKEVMVKMLLVNPVLLRVLLVNLKLFV